MITDLPDTLVLGAGGTLGEAWMRGLLSGIGLDFRGCEYILGTSAGSIVAATLVSGRELEAGDRATRAWDTPRSPAPRFGLARAAARAGTVVVSPLAPLAFAGLTPPGRLARSAMLAASPRPQRTLGRLGGHIERSTRASTAGCASPRSSAPAARASCSARREHRPRASATRSSRRARFRGCSHRSRSATASTSTAPSGARSTSTPRPAAAARDVLCLAPTAGAGPLTAVTKAALVAEEMALIARGTRVRTIVPDTASAAAIGPHLMQADRVEDVLDAAFAQGRALTASA